MRRCWGRSDVGFGDVVYPKTSTVEYPAILDLPGPRLKGYPPESMVSEKFEAMVKLGVLNSRMKDFYDIWLIIRQFDFNGSALAGALKRTFGNRKTVLPEAKPLFAEEIYNAESDRQLLWKAFIRKGQIKHAPDRLSAVAGEIENFLIEPVLALGKEADFKKKWKAPGPWK